MGCRNRLSPLATPDSKRDWTLRSSGRPTWESSFQNRLAGSGSSSQPSDPLEQRKRFKKKKSHLSTDFFKCREQLKNALCKRRTAWINLRINWGQRHKGREWCAVFTKAKKWRQRMSWGKNVCPSKKLWGREVDEEEEDGKEGHLF